MNLIDSSGWLQFFMNGQLAERYESYLEKFGEVLTPTIVLYEVYKRLKAELNEQQALWAAVQMERTNIVALTPAIAYHAADLALEHKLAMADAIVYSTADVHDAKLITSDKDFKDLPKVLYINPEEEF